MQYCSGTSPRASPSLSDQDITDSPDDEPHSKCQRMGSPAPAPSFLFKADATAAESVHRFDEPSLASRSVPSERCERWPSPQHHVPPVHSSEPCLYAHFLFVWSFKNCAKRLLAAFPHSPPLLFSESCPFTDVSIGQKQRVRLLGSSVLCVTLARKLLCFRRQITSKHPAALAASILSRRHVWHLPASHATCLSTLRGHSFGRSGLGAMGRAAEVVTVAFHACLPLLATGGRDGTVKLWLLNADGIKLKREGTITHGDRSVVTAVTFHPRLPLLATGSQDRTIQLWLIECRSPPTATCTAKLTGHSHHVISVAFHLRMPLLATSSRDGTAKLWLVDADGLSAACASTVKIKSHSTLNFVAFHPWLPLATTGHELLLFNSEANAVVHTSPLHGPKVNVTAVAFHPCQQLLATSSCDLTVTLWRVSADGSAATRSAVLDAHDFSVVSMSFHACLPLLATGSRDRTAKLWLINADATAATCCATLEGHNGPVTAVAFHSRLPLLATGSWDGTAKLWR
jgi:WD40 repeat protein